MPKDPNPASGPQNWDEDPISGLARELRATVGAELRAEAEIVELETEIGRRRQRSIPDVAREAAHRGDTVSVVAGDRTLTGHVVHVGRDYLSLETGSESIDVRLTAAAFSIVRRPAGGLTTGGGSITFRARLSEYEQTNEVVTVITSVAPIPIEGRIEVVATDHVIVRDRDRVETILPLDTVELVVRVDRRPPHR